MPAAPDLTVVLSTYNRAALLGDAVRSLLALDPGSPPHEIVVVDNNSRDDTRAVVEALIPDSAGRLRYVFEGRQGLSNARNAGIANARGRLVAFTDDDVRVDPGWAAAVVRAFDAHPEVLFVGGKVLPMWPSPPPPWLTELQWGPLALLDAGPAGFETNAARAMCFVGANVAFRRETFDRYGNFDPRHHHKTGAVTAVEDHEFELRLYVAGERGWYEPTAIIHAEVQSNRLTKRYHRKWHHDHGRAAVWLLPPRHVFDENWVARPAPPDARLLLGVPLFHYRGLLRAAGAWLRATARGRADEAMRQQGEFWEAIGALRTFVERRGEYSRAYPTPAATGH